LLPAAPEEGGTVNRDSVIIERIGESVPTRRSETGSGEELWRVVQASGREGPCVVAGKRAAVDLALTRLSGTAGELYIRADPDAEPEPFNPAGA
jgi:hypothetical protein